MREGRLNARTLNEHQYKFLCSLHKCRKEVLSTATLRKHEKRHKDCAFVYEKCTAAFPYASELEQHAYIHGEDQQLKCKYPNCNAKYKTRYKHDHHYRQHRSSKEFPCELCNKVLDMRKSYLQHTRKHSDELPEKCKMCELILNGEMV